MHPDTRVVPFTLPDPPANQITAQHWKERALEAERLALNAYEALEMQRKEWADALRSYDERTSTRLLWRIIRLLAVFAVGVVAGMLRERAF